MARGRRSYALILFVGVVTTALGVVLVVPVLVVTGVIELALYGVATVRVRRR